MKITRPTKEISSKIWYEVFLELQKYSYINDYYENCDDDQYHKLAKHICKNTSSIRCSYDDKQQINIFYNDYCAYDNHLSYLKEYEIEYVIGTIEDVLIEIDKIEEKIIKEYFYLINFKSSFTVFDKVIYKDNEYLIQNVDEKLGKLTLKEIDSNYQFVIDEELLTIVDHHNTY